MSFDSFVEGPLLWIAFLTFIIGSLFRIAIFFGVSLKKDKLIYKHFNLKYVFISIFRWLLPANKDVVKNPVFTVLVYIFHICLLVVPIWYSTHIALWEQSRFEWWWTPIPDGLADIMTLVFLVIALVFLLRRIFLPSIRMLSTFSDYLILIATALPFMTGYFLTHGTLDSIGFISNNIYIIHILSAELMLILIPFTKLSHFILFFFSRASTAVDLGRRGYSV